MGKVIMNAAVSLDGFIGGDDDMPGPLFDWYGNGDVEVSLGGGQSLRTSAASAGFLREVVASTGVVLLGRRLFDITNGWEGRPPAGDHCVVLTHEVPSGWPHHGTAPFTFVTTGIRDAVAQARALAGDRDVSLTAGDVGSQALREGLVDQVVLNLVPAVLGTGVPFFGAGSLSAPILLEDPRIIAGDRVTHLVFDVRR